jgi:AAA domain/Bifunctional DNA primase/polymerase, N-terminal
LIANGYEPVAVNGKRPVAAEWQKRPNTVMDLADERAAYPHAISTGLRTGSLAGVDIDIWPITSAPEGYTGWMDHTYAIEELAADVLGHTDMKRVGAKGAMLVYRNETPIGKITIKGEHPTLTQRDPKHPNHGSPLKAKIEILGIGQQFVAYGPHPDTGKPYTWTNSILTDAEPLLRPYVNLVEVTPDTLREFARRAVVLLAELGYENVSISDPGDPAKRAARVAKRRQDRAPVLPEELIEILSHIDPGCERNEWVGYLGAIQATNLRGVAEDEMDVELLEIAQAWARGDYHGGAPANWVSDDDVEHTYWTLDPETPGGTTFGTLYHAARENGYDKPPPQPTAEEKYGDPAAFTGAREGWPQFQTAPSVSYVERLRCIRDAAGESGGPRYEPPPAPPRFMTATELDAYASPVGEDIWQGLVLRQLVNLLYGDGEAGKTMLSAHLAVARAAGLSDLFGHRVAQGSVLMVLCEDAYKRIKPAMRMICEHLGVPLRGLPITFCCQPDDPVLAMIGDKGEAQYGPFVFDLCEKIAELAEPLVVLDTVSDIAELNESLRLPPNTLIKKILQPICDVFGATVLVTAHPSAAQLNSGRLTSGSTAWRNAVRNALGLTTKGGVRHLSNSVKNSYGNTSDIYLSMAGPVFTRIDAPAASEEQSELAILAGHLEKAKARSWGEGLLDEELAARYEGPPPEKDDLTATAAWKTGMKKRLKFLRNKRRYPAGRGFGDERCQLSGEVLIWRWFLPGGVMV